MGDEPDPPITPDPLTEVLRRALERPPELVPGLKRAPYRRGEVAARRRRRARR